MKKYALVFLSSMLFCAALTGCDKSGTGGELPDPLSSNDNKILRFSINGVEGKIFWQDYGSGGEYGFDWISITLPYSTDLSALIPKFEVSPGATVVPAAGSIIDFSGSGVQYFVTDGKGLTREYSVSVDLDSPMYSIGDYYPDAKDPSTAMGVIIYLDESREHGTAVSCNQAYGLQWSTELVENDLPGSGPASLAWIKANRDINKYPAFKWCADKGDGWYLPSGAEIWSMTFAMIFDKLNPALQQVAGAAEMRHDAYYLTCHEQNYVYTSAYWVSVSGQGYEGVRKDATTDCYTRAMMRF